MFASGVHAQPEPLPCIDCGFELTLISLDDEGQPGDLLRAGFRIENTGRGDDRYEISVESGDQTWYSDTDTGKTANVPAGSGALGGDANSTLFNVTVAVPVDARAKAETQVTVTVTSVRMEGPDGTKTHTFKVRAGPFERWRIDCDARVTVQTAHEETIRFLVQNLGNIRRQVRVVPDVPEGFVVGEPLPVDIEPGASYNGTFVIGAGLRAQEGEHLVILAVRPDSTNQTNITHHLCETRVTVVAQDPDAPVATHRDDEDEESPPASTVAFLSVLSLLLLARRQPRRARPVPRAPEVGP